MSSAADRATAAQVLKDAGHDVGRIADLLGVSESQVYRYLSEFPRHDPPSHPSASDQLERLLAGQELDEFGEFMAASARQAATKFDQMARSDKAQDGQNIPQLLKGLVDLVERIVGPSKADEEWLLGVFAPVGHFENLDTGDARRPGSEDRG